MNVKLLRRWGTTPPGTTVRVDPVQGRWLVDHAYGTAHAVPAPDQTAFMPGADGPDPLASGDGTRRGNPAMVKGARRGNNAAPIAGSPVQYNAGIADPTQPNDDDATSSPSRHRRKPTS